MKLQTVFAGAVASAFLSVSVVTASAASVTNGDFEAVQIGFPFSSANLANIPGWTHTGTLGEGPLWAIGYTDSLGSVTVAGSGRQFVTLGGGFGFQGSASWTTTITGLTPGNSYNLNFMIAYEGANTLQFTTQQSMTVGFNAGSSTQSQIFSASGTNAVNYWRTWLPETLLFTATGTSAIVFLGN
jgi:hypothetical protein